MAVVDVDVVVVVAAVVDVVVVAAVAVVVAVVAAAAMTSRLHRNQPWEPVVAWHTDPGGLLASRDSGTRPCLSSPPATHLAPGSANSNCLSRWEIWQVILPLSWFDGWRLAGGIEPMVRSWCSCVLRGAS